jgi:hypothetical protein
MEETIEQKYDRIRPLITNGCLGLVRGKSLIAKGIEWADKAYFSHAFLIYAVGDRLLCIQAMADGVQPNFLSQEIFANVDFCILQPQFPQEHIDDCVNAAFTKAEKGIHYNYKQLLNILIQKKFGYDIQQLHDSVDNICSVFAAWTYGSLLPLKCYSQEVIKADYISPMDLIRFLDPSEIKIIG